MSHGDHRKLPEGLEGLGKGSKLPAGDSDRQDTLHASTEMGGHAFGEGTCNSPIEPAIPEELVDHPRYRVERFLGRGGMGVVWLARHKVMDRWVALKAIRSDFLSDADAQSRFRREVQAQGRLHHPNIATAFDAEQIGNTTFLVVEYVQGVTLQEAVAKRSLSLPEICSAVRDAALGLHHAHEHGLIHRDVKPSNLIRTGDGSVKVLDFGLVSIADVPTEVTLKGVLIGTPDYIAPEQAENPKKADERSDIYSLGCTFYFLLTGRPPFAGSSFLSKLDAHRHETPAPIPKIPEPIQKILFKMMAKRPEARFASAREVADALAPFCTGMGDFPIRKQDTWHVNRSWLAMVFVLLLGVMVLVYGWSKFSSEESWKGPLPIASPTRISDGNESDIRVLGKTITLDGTKNQIWVDYEDCSSREFRIRCRVRYVQKSSGNYFKIIFQTPAYDDYHLMLNIDDTVSGMVWDTSSTKGKGVIEPQLWSSDLLETFQELEIHVRDGRVEAKLGDHPTMMAELPTKEERHLALAAMNCVVEVEDLEVFVR